MISSRRCACSTARQRKCSVRNSWLGSDPSPSAVKASARKVAQLQTEWRASAVRVLYRAPPCSATNLSHDPLANLRLYFQSLPRCSSRNSFLFKLLHGCPRWHGVLSSPFSLFHLRSPLTPLECTPTKKGGWVYPLPGADLKSYFKSEGATI